MRGSLRECHFVTVLDDDLCKLPQEYFFAELAESDLNDHRLIEINIPTTQLQIDNSDGSAQLECGKYTIQN